MQPTIVWIANELRGAGGGPKLLFEGAKYFRTQGYRVVIITWFFHESALFDGLYSAEGIIVLREAPRSKKHIFLAAWNRLKGLYRVRTLLQELQPEMVFVQSEYDVAVAYLCTLFGRFQYSFLIFGQMFQFADDMAKYAFVFRKHLKTIIASQKGYQDTIPAVAPQMNLLDRWANEIICLIRFWAVRKATARFVFSKALQWETKLLYNRPAQVLKGAFDEGIFSANYEIEATKKRYQIPENEVSLLSLSQLHAKKRIDVMIKSLVYLPEKFNLFVAGVGGEFQNLQALSDTLNLGKRIHFLGYISETDVRALQRACDIFLSMDIGDYDISPMEALALNRKTIVPPEFDLDKTLAQNLNLRISDPEPQALAEVILSFVEHKNELNSNLMKAYTWQNYFREIEKTCKVESYRSFQG